MAGLKLTPEQIEALEFQTSQVYDSLNRAVKTRQYQDAAWAVKVFNPLGNSLSIAAGDSAFMDWNRGTQRADLMDRYLLQFTVGHLPAIELEKVVSYEENTGEKWDFKATTVSEEDVKRALGDKKMPYLGLEIMAGSLGDAGHFEEVVRLITHIRDTYARPKL